MVIDDDPISNFICDKLLVRANPNIETQFFVEARKALQFLANNHQTDKLPDVILLDLNMPIVNGWQFLEGFKKLQPVIPKKIHVFILSSSVFSYDIEKASLEGDVQGYMMKPLSKEKVKTFLLHCEKLSMVCEA
jgi:CheY-like chemotaxis protein